MYGFIATINLYPAPWHRQGLTLSYSLLLEHLTKTERRR